MVDDPIIRELHKVKDESAARHGNDVRQVAKALERRYGAAAAPTATRKRRIVASRRKAV